MQACDPSNQSSWKNESCSEDFNTHLCNCQENRWENIHFESKHRIVTPQIDRLGKMSPVLRVSTQSFGVSKEIDGKNIHFESKPSHVTPQINRLGETSPVLRVLTHIFGTSKEIDGKTFILRVNLGI